MAPKVASASKPPKRKEEVLAVASEVMGQSGVVSTRLQDVADHLGVAYTALYHYFPSRDHLAEEVLIWNIDNRRALLDEARGESALDRLANFVSADLLEKREQKIRIPVLIPLPEENRRPVLARRSMLRDDIAALIETGIKEGSIRECHAVTIANLIVTTLERFTRHDANVSATIRNAEAEFIAAELTSLFRIGLLRNRKQIPTPSFCISSGDDLLGVMPDIDPEIERLEQIYRVATRHFNAEGSQASIPRMATELGVSKTVIYQYAIDKQELLFNCYARGASVVERSQRLASIYGKDPLDKIVIHRKNLYLFHDSAAGPFTLLNAVEHLKPQHQRIINLRNRGVRETSVQRLNEALDAGYLRQDMNAVVTQAVIGQSLYGLPSWFNDAYPLSIEDVANQAMMLHYQGLQVD